MAIFTFANNINTTLASAVSTGATSITLASSANLPTSIPAGMYLVITLNDQATRGNFEVMYATAVSGATLTVLRAQEGTAALSWLVGDYAFSGPTKGQQAGFGQTGGTNTWSGVNTFSDEIIVPTPTGSTQPVQLGQFASVLSGNGSIQIPSSPNNLILQFGGTGPSSSSTTTAVTFSEPFPNACLQVILGAVVITNAADIATMEGSPTRTGFNYGCWSISNTRVAGLGATYIAIGY